MRNILLLTPLTGNGGIASWSHKFIKTFGKGKYTIIPVDRAVKGRDFDDNSVWSRFSAGIKELIVIRRKVKSIIIQHHIDILHTTTSGSFGTFRDFIISKLCKSADILCVMHCHYGCITEDVHRGLYGWFLRKTMRQFNQIWVLDSRSLNSLKQIKGLTDKVYLTPNSIEVKEGLDIRSKDYRHIAFIGNLIPTKGLYELVEAICRLNNEKVKLSIVGSGDDEVINHIKEIAKDRIDKSIFILGRLPNAKAVEFMKTVDILALPTYYPWEAFPISILEAMSLGKLVISTPRAAIKDMLTAQDGSECGILVREHSVDDITNALKWCYDNPLKADELCKKAYDKVYNAYRMEVVYDLYDSLYQKMLSKKS